MDGTERKKIREREKYDRLKKRLTEYIDISCGNFVNKWRYSFTVNVKDRVFDGDDLYSVLKVVESYLEEFRVNEKYGGWDFKLNPDTLQIKCYNAGRKKKYDEEEEKRKADEKEKYDNCKKLINDYIDKCKNENYRGVFSMDKINELLYHGGLPDLVPELFVDKYIVPFRDDFRLVNPKQYKIIYNNSDNLVVFEIKGNKPFYDDSAAFDGKKLKRFLDASKKVYIDNDLFFVPFSFKKDSHFYVLVVNNLLENIEQYRLPSLNYLNKQHNLYYVIETNFSESFKGSLNDFKNYVLKECQKIVKHNTNKLYGSYTKISHFKGEKIISKQYK